MLTFAHELDSGKLFPNGAAESGFSPPLCFVENSLPALLVAGLTPSGSDRSTPLPSA
jgi:hypothetical protein